ncbi:MAG: hypothetical protein C0425_00115 [Chlorobiaceae bacterium]|nr:hypothetical protein [Chlorobiaceae bacterium]MBA4308727.1 hypothetical protein [Chlorobiaceae bacterium]
MKLKCLLFFSIFLLQVCVTAQTVRLWERNSASMGFVAADNTTRSLALNISNNTLLLATRTGGVPNIFILNAATGDSVGRLDMTGVTGGTFLINIVKVTSDGVIYACNLTTNGVGFKIYRWANQSAIPTVAFSGDIGTLRIGDALGLSGSGASTVIYASGSANTNVLVFTTTDGLTFTNTATIPVTAGLARGAISPIGTGPTSDIWVKGAGTAATRVSSTGTVIDAIPTTTIATGWSGITSIVGSDGRRMLGFVGINSAADLLRFLLVDVTAGGTTARIITSDSLRNLVVGNTNTNATGEVIIRESGTSNYYFVYSLISNNGVAAYRTNFLTIAQARRDLDNNAIPDRLNDTVFVTGVTFSPNYQTSNRSYYIWDGTAGIATFRTGLTSPVFKMRDSVAVLGTILQFNGLTQIQPLTDASARIIMDTLGILPRPILVSLPVLLANAEFYEGSLIGMMAMNKFGGSPAWPATGASANMLFHQSNVLTDTIIVRIDSDTDIDGNPEPTWPRDLVGVFSQFHSTNLRGGYQLQPRFFATDFPPLNTIPVELVSFTAKSVGNNVTLNWSTATETNNMGFSVERSVDQNNFMEIGFVSGKGTSIEKNNYSFVDRNLNVGEYYYRLKQVDFDGTVSYSSIINIDVNQIPTTFELSQNFPNPFNPSTSIKFSVDENGPAKLLIYNLLGQKVHTLFDEVAEVGTIYKVNFNAVNLNSGVYFYSLIQNSKTLTKKMTLLK